MFNAQMHKFVVTHVHYMYLASAYEHAVLRYFFKESHLKIREGSNMEYKGMCELGMIDLTLTYIYTCIM